MNLPASMETPSRFIQDQKIPTESKITSILIHHSSSSAMRTLQLGIQGETSLITTFPPNANTLPEKQCIPNTCS